MSERCIVCTVTHESTSNKIVLFPGISVEELSALTQSLFALDSAPIGFQGRVCTNVFIYLLFVEYVYLLQFFYNCTWYHRLGWIGTPHDSSMSISRVTSFAMYSHLTETNNYFHGSCSFSYVEQYYHHNEHLQTKYSTASSAFTNSTTFCKAQSSKCKCWNWIRWTRYYCIIQYVL